MFTGIIEEIGTIKRIAKIGTDQIELSVQCSMIQDDLKIGDSVSVNGVCLTVIRFDQSMVAFEVSSETMSTASLSTQNTGSLVNLERALRLIDRLGGHIVQGHVDCVAKLLNIKELGDFFEIDFSLPTAARKYAVKKGSITVDGISLTIAELGEDWFRVAVIPHTFRQTNLCHKKIGDPVNLESDVLARYVENLLKNEETEQKTSLITEEFLKNHGF